MKIVNFIDLFEVYSKVKENQLENYPTANEYKEELESFGENYDFVDDMYVFFEKFPEDAQISDELSDKDSIDLENNKITFEFSVSGNNATENGNDYWGYGWTFVVDLETDLFIDFYYENYS